MTSTTVLYIDPQNIYDDKLSDQRQAPRRCLWASATANFEQSVVHGYSVNVSPGGVLIQTDSALPALGDTCWILLDLPDGVAQAAGTVLRVHPMEGSFAVEFLELDPASRRLLFSTISGLVTSGSY